MKTVGQTLNLERKKRKLTIENIQKAIKIHPKFIKALEEDDYTVFDGEVHAKGFLRIYADFLGLPIDEMLALWRREHAQHFETTGLKKDHSRFRALQPSKIVLSPTLLITTLIGVLLLVFFGYLYYQYRHYVGDPQLTITHPDNNQIVTDSVVDITGKTDIDAQIFVNNQKVFLNPDGSFAASVNLKEGINTLSILAVNKLEKQTEVIRTIIHRPPSPSVSVPESTPSVDE